ncbi:hypothetical protein B0H17DRAFT_1335610 [Mycena rosella]|uniref:Uncharacterized protein n=1 Tax=Mycena rosella TaxID=1033263 RepID=A0AAD7CYY3_MYCRO|nr:hypothetical protein B0H17DRAFT_1335610 [Mycena rosella]
MGLGRSCCLLCFRVALLFSRYFRTLLSVTRYDRIPIGSSPMPTTSPAAPPVTTAPFTEAAPPTTRPGVSTGEATTPLTADVSFISSSNRPVLCDVPADIGAYPGASPTPSNFSASLGHSPKPSPRQSLGSLALADARRELELELELEAAGFPCPIFPPEDGIPTDVSEAESRSYSTRRASYVSNYPRRRSSGV